LCRALCAILSVTDASFNNRAIRQAEEVSSKALWPDRKFLRSLARNELCSFRIRESVELGFMFCRVRELLQPRVLRLGFFQDGNVGVGVFPEREEILIRRLGFGGVALHGIGSG
jgi:hypothetical protein